MGRSRSAGAGDAAGARPRTPRPPQAPEPTDPPDDATTAETGVTAPPARRPLPTGRAIPPLARAAVAARLTRRGATPARPSAPSAPTREASPATPATGATGATTTTTTSPPTRPTVDTATANALVDSLLAPGALTIAVQPMVRLVDGAVVAYEALARSAAVPGLPDEWLETAATVGRRTELELACLEAVARLGAPPDGAPLSINISPSAVLDARLPQVLARLPRHALEITEHQAVADYEELCEVLDRLRATGTLVAVDDVGAGYASMAHVLALAPTFVKIDRSLVDGMHTDPARRAVVQALHAFTAAIGGMSVAEGVEDLADLRALRAVGVDLVQGFGVAPPADPWPLPGTAALRVLRPGADDPLPSGAGDAAALEAALAAATTQAQACDVVAAHIAAVGGLLPTVYLERGGVLRCQAGRGQWLVLDGLHPGVGITGQAYAEEREVVVDDVTTDPRYRAAAPGVRAEIAVPLRIDGRVVGVCNVDTVVPLSSAARALVRRCVAQLEDRLDRLSIGPDTSVALHELSRITPALMASDDVEALASATLTGVRDLVDFTSGCLWHVADGSVGAAVGPQGRALAMLPPGRVQELAALLTGVSSCVAGGSGTSLAFAATDALRDLGARGVLLVPVRDRQHLTDLLVVVSPSRPTVEPGLLVAAEQLCLLAGARLAALRDRSRVPRRVPGAAVPPQTPAPHAPAGQRPSATAQATPVAPPQLQPQPGPGPTAADRAASAVRPAAAPSATGVPAPAGPQEPARVRGTATAALQHRTAAGHPTRTPAARTAASAADAAAAAREVPTASLLPAVLSALEATSTAVAVLPESGVLGFLAGTVRADLLAGYPARALDRTRSLHPVVAAAGDRVTAWHLRLCEARALVGLGRFAEALDVARALAVELAGGARAWQCAALALVAEASSLLGATTESLEALSEADWMLRQVRTRTSGHLWATIAVVRATRAAHLYERADTLLRAVGPVPAPEHELLLAHERALLTAEWMTMLALVGRAEESAALASRALTDAMRLQAVAERATAPGSLARGQVLEAAAWLAHGEPQLAGAVARAVAMAYDRDAMLPETAVLSLVLGSLAEPVAEPVAEPGERPGEDPADASEVAAVHLRAAVDAATACGRSVWANAARTSLAELESARGGPQAVDLWREVATTSMGLAWAERGARVAAMGSHDVVRALSASAEGHGRASEEDPLTGLGNRRLLRRVAQGMAPEAVVFVDVDRFKAVNDTYSHAVGDRVLQALARILRATSRVGDLLVRYGGDEFVVVPHGGQDAARRLAHRVRAAVEGFDWSTLAPGLEITVSVGLGTGGAGADGVLAADEAMLRAKRAGRNQVVEAAPAAGRDDAPA